MRVGTYRTDRSMIVTRLIHRVAVNGATRSDVECESITLSAGTMGSQASLRVLGDEWDTAKESWDGKFVQVWARYEGGDEVQLFNGWVASVGGDARRRYPTMIARSALGWADRVYLGQDWAAETNLVVRYPADYWDGAAWVAAGWTPKEILKDWFSGNEATAKGGGGSLPNGWRTRLKLGSLAVLGRAFNEIDLGGLEFQQATLRDALDQMLERIGTVGIRERFDSNDCILDFFELADAGAPAQQVVVARRGESILGSNVLDIVHERGEVDVRTRLMVMGDRRRYTVSVSTEHPTAPLERAWDPVHEQQVLDYPDGEVDGALAIASWSGNGTHVTVVTTGEHGVTLPMRVSISGAGDINGTYALTSAGGTSLTFASTVTGSGASGGVVVPEDRGIVVEYQPPKAFVFRRFRLPECLRRLRVEQDIPLDLSDGTRPRMQVWKFPRTYVWDEEAGEYTSAASTTPELITGWEYDPATGYITLGKPATNLVGTVVAEEPDETGTLQAVSHDTFEGAVVGVTLTVAAERLMHDTGVRANSMDMDGIGDQGLVEAIVNEQFGFHQITNVGAAFADGAGGEHTFPTCFVLLGEEGGVWSYWPAAEVTRDDEENLIAVAEAALREKNPVRENYTVTIPWATWAHRIGDRIEIVGQDDFSFGTHQVMTISHSLGRNHQSSISTDTAVPTVASEILGEG